MLASPVSDKRVETLQERQRIQRQLYRTVDGTKLTTDDVRTVVASVKEIVAVRATANPADKAEAYAEMGNSLTYHQNNPICGRAPG